MFRHTVFYRNFFSFSFIQTFQFVNKLGQFTYLYGITHDELEYVLLKNLSVMAMGFNREYNFYVFKGV